ncbi:MAG TPA: hypothetical protein VHU90_10485, partial [Galbitalea sp.]|nr:hypothetical protein [Galbitalea sp.]
MPASSTSTLSLAGRLRDLGDEDLTALLTLREVRDVRVRDFFDLADSLLDPVSVRKACAGLDRATLAAIWTLGAQPDGATSGRIAGTIATLETDAETVEADLTNAFRLALIDRADALWLPYDAIVEQFESWPAEGLPDLASLLDEPAPASLSPVSQTDARFTDHAAGEHAFNSTNAVAALLAELQRDPARELAR